MSVLGDPRQFSVEHRLLNLSILLVLSLGALGIPQAFGINTRPESVAIAVGGVGCAALSYYLSRVRGRMRAAAVVFFGSFAASTSLQWFQAAGSQGVVPYYFVWLMLQVALIARRPLPYLGLILVDIVALVAIEHAYPNAVTTGRSREVHAFSLLLTLGIMTVYIWASVRMHLSVVTSQSRLLQSAHQALAEKVDAAAAADRSKSQFFASMSHEFRTPLNSIIGFSRRLSEKPPANASERERAALESIHRNGNHLLCLVNDILDLSSLEAGKLRFRFESVALEPLLHEVRLNLESLFAERGVEMHIEMREPGLEVHADPIRLTQVLMNLISNAIRYGEGQDFCVRCRRDNTRRKASVLIEVEDRGGGIPEEERATLFEPYAGIVCTSRRNSQSTGLGLSIAARLVYAHGGTIEYIPRDQGSLFLVRLPVEPEALPTTDEPGRPSFFDRLPHASRAGARQDTVAPSEAARNPTAPHAI